jgi:ADP-heptose:LPS heptosyltransferase
MKVNYLIKFYRYYFFILKKINKFKKQKPLLDLNKNLHKLLIIQLQNIGDSLIFLPTLKAISENYPKCKIDVLANRTSYEIYKNNLYIQKIITLKDWKVKKNDFHLCITNFILSLFLLKKKKYDCILLDANHTHYAYGILSHLIGAKYRIGFQLFYANNYLTHTHNIQKNENLNYLEANLYIARFFNISKKIEKRIIFNYSKSDINYVDKILPYSKNSFFIGLNIFAKKPVCQWPLINFSLLIKKILLKFPLATIILLGKNDKNKYPINEFINPSKKIINLIDKTSLQQFCFILSKLKLFVTLDTGPMHLCSHHNTKTLCLLSGIDYKSNWTYKYKGYQTIQHFQPCSPCNQIECPNQTYKCINSISINEVFEKITNMLNIHNLIEK